MEKSNVYHFYNGIGSLIKPSKSCFYDAILSITNFITSDPLDLASIRLAHGICLSEQCDQPFAHAWIESDNSVWQQGTLGARKCSWRMDKRAFYDEYNVIDCTLYSLKDIAANGYKSGNNGPWKESYRNAIKLAPDLIPLNLRPLVDKIVFHD